MVLSQNQRVWEEQSFLLPEIYRESLSVCASSLHHVGVPWLTPLDTAGTSRARPAGKASIQATRDSNHELAIEIQHPLRRTPPYSAN